MRRRPHAALLYEAVRIREGLPPVPVRLIDGRWVSDDSTTPERRYTADNEHPGGSPGFPCLPMPDPLPPTPEEEMAPWDDPMIMSTEDLADLVGL